MRTLNASVIYFILVFAVGWVLGPIREFWVVPHLGPIVGTLFEVPLMLAAMIAAASLVIRLFEIPYRLGTRFAIGLFAFGILLIAETAGVVWVRGMSIHDYFVRIRTIPGLISLPLFVLFAVMPALIGRVPRESRGRI
jgi:hypothetical protein